MESNNDHIPVKSSSGRCSLCHNVEEVSHVSLYVYGSEGLWLCHSCKMLVVEYCRKLGSLFLQLRKEEYLRRQA